MRRICLLCLSLMVFLAGCATAPAKPVIALDHADFRSPVTGDQLHLGLRGPYDLTYANVPPNDRNRPKVVHGHWDLLSAPMQLITLDGKTPLRLSHHPSAAVPWRYEPVTLVARSTIGPNSLDDYVEVQGQWLIPKQAVQATSDEQPIAEMLSPEARGTR